MKQQLRTGGTTDELVFSYQENGRVLAPQSASVSIYKWGTLVVSSEVTPGADGVLRYAPGLPVTGESYPDLRAEWTITTSDGKQRVYTQLFDVVKSVVYPLITDEDLIAEAQSLESSDAVVYGSAEAGSETTLVDAQRAGSLSRGFAGGIIEFTSGSQAGNTRVVKSFDAKTGTFTWDSALSTAIVSGDGYLARKTFSPQRERAWEDLLFMLEQRGNRPALMVTPEALKVPHLYLTLSKVFLSLSDEDGDIEWARGEKYRKMFEAVWSGLTFEEDRDQDGEPDGETTVRNIFRR